jgi:type IV pilus secretin PilQ/predicted competence protein
MEPENRRMVIESKGTVGDHLARVMARPNRLILDFKQTGVDRIPGTIAVADRHIKEIRVGSAESRARIVVDFRDNPVPPFQVTRANNQVTVVFGKGLAAHDSAGTGAPADARAGAQATPSLQPPAGKGPVAALAPASPASTVSPAAESTAGPGSALAGQKPQESKPGATETAKANTGWTVGTWTASAAAPPQASANGQRRVAQSLEFNTPSSTIRDRRAQPETSGDSASGLPTSMASSQGVPDQRGMPREVRPPVTPPPPDPRLLVQEITELQFIQVGHNGRLVVRGGDHLDYRLNNVSPTKVRIDLINAEIPKLHQKPLRTDQFSTSVEMIVPGSQTIFVQLKDAVPLQVEKQKGVLMIDFPPPRFQMTGEQRKAGGGATAPGEGDNAAREAFKKSSEDRRQAIEAIREQEILKNNEVRRKGIESLQKQQEELEKQRTEILKRYRVTPDPQIFQKPVSMDFQGISLKNAFRLLAEQAGINIIVDDKVTGTTTLRLFQVPLGQVLDTILNSHELDREMVGNVMRIGKRKDIEDLKKARKDEYEQRMGEVTSRLKQLAEEMRAKTDESQAALKELEKTTTQQVEEVKEEVKFEDVGEAGCIKIGNKDVCFQFVNIRLVYVDPGRVIPVLKCMFNLDCPGDQQSQTSGRGGGDLGILGAPAAVAQSSAQMGLLGPAQQLAANNTALAAGALAQGAAQEGGAVGGGGGPTVAGGAPGSNLAQGAGVALQGRTGRAVATGSYDQDLEKIIAYSVLAPDNKNRSIYIKDTPERISAMKKVIYQLDVPEGQVTIEGRLVEASKSWSRALGVLWGGRNNQNGPLHDNRTSYWGFAGLQGGATANTPTGESTNGNNIPSSFAVNFPAALAGATNPINAIGVQFGLLATQYITELDYRIQIGEATGQTKTVSRPKVTVLNKQAASIKNGKQIPYVVTGPAGTQTQLISADLLLDVVPEIFADGRIRMRIKFTNNEPDQSFTPPAITTREAQTIMDVKDGQTAVIGGIVKTSDGYSRQGWPGLMNVPVINWFFSNKSVSDNLTEILVFITPIIVKRPPPAS